MATDANVAEKMDSEAHTSHVNEVMYQDCNISIDFSGTPLTGYSSLNVKFTDGTVCTAYNIQETMTPKA